MFWFIISISIAVISAIVNVLDKHILGKYLRSSAEAVGVLGVFSAIFFVVLTPIRILLAGSPDLGFFWYPFFAGFFEVVYIYFYLKAIDKEDVAYMVPIFAIAPIFSLLPAWFLLHQGIGLIPLFGMIAVLLGLLLLAWSKNGKLSKPSKYYAHMVLAAFFYAINGIFLGKGLEHYNLFDNLLLSRIGIAIGCIFLLCMARRLTSIHILNPKNYIFLFSEFFYLITVWLFILAIETGPVAYVMGVINIQPVFVLLISVLLWKFYPYFLAEHESVHFQKPFVTALGVSVVVAGSILIYI